MSELRDQDDLRARLSALREDPPDAGFSAALHRKLVASGPPDPPGLWRRLWPPLGQRAPLLWSAFAGAAVCALLIAAVLSRSALVPPQAQESALATVEFPATKVAMVRVNLSAEVAVQSAEIQVTLPDGLVFWADGQALAQRSFSWSQPLRAGDNDIPIAVRGLRPGHYRMTVTAKMGNAKVEDDVLLEVVDG